tara:strand:+ start:5702 stop:6451 length:750 start_codon:yes stop_codon:yes gene_type:complete
MKCYLKEYVKSSSQTEALNSKDDDRGIIERILQLEFDDDIMKYFQTPILLQNYLVQFNKELASTFKSPQQKKQKVVNNIDYIDENNNRNLIHTTVNGKKNGNIIPSKPTIVTPYESIGLKYTSSGSISNDLKISRYNAIMVSESDNFSPACTTNKHQKINYKDSNSRSRGSTNFITTNKNCGSSSSSSSSSTYNGSNIILMSSVSSNNNNSNSKSSKIGKQGDNPMFNKQMELNELKQRSKEVQNLFQD